MALVMPQARAGETMLSADTAWQHLDDKEGVTLFSRGRAGSAVKEFKGVGQIAAAPALVERVLRDVTNYPAFMPYVSVSKVISDTDTATVSYQQLDLPFVRGRDYTTRTEHGSVKNPAGALVYRDTWQADNDDGPAETRGLVRVKLTEGSWLLEPADGGGTRATYQIYTDSGGALPAFLCNRASQMTIPRLFEALRKQVRDPKYAK
jgi:carbon monoxide dehydrogenase subunit G